MNPTGSIRRPITTAIAVALVLLGAGACSGGSDSPAPDRAAGTAPASDAAPTPSPVAADAGAPSAAADASTAAATPGAGFAPVALSQPQTVRPGDTVTAAFQARPGSTCQLSVTGDNGSTPPFEPAVADTAGRVSWTWKLSSDTERGSLKAWVSCSGGGVAQAELTVV